MIGFGLRQLQIVLNHKADEVQHEFVAISDRLEKVGRLLLEEVAEDRERLKAEQGVLRARQALVADNINLWRQRARGVLQQRGGTTLRAYLEELNLLEDAEVRAAVQHTLYLMDAPPEELERLAAEQGRPEAKRTPVGRLIERGRTDYDLRGADPAARQRASVEFANRPGMAMDMEAIAEAESYAGDDDPIVRELAALTAIQLHRFRAMRMADLDVAHQAVQALAKIPNSGAIPALVEILETPRSGFVLAEGSTVESDNNRSRMVALLRLAEWHTAEAQAAIRARRFDRDSSIVRAAKRALELFPGDWDGTLKRPEPPA